MEENIEKLRKEAIPEIKEKIKNNPKYLSPMNKDRQEDMKRFKFVNGYEFTRWMWQNGILKNPTDVDRVCTEKKIKNSECRNIKEYEDRCAQDAGFKDHNERRREREWEKGKRFPKEFNADCSSYFGDFTESLMIQTFEDAIRMPYGNPGYDWTCKKGDKIDNKGRCLSYDNNSNWSGWNFPIRWNNIADWFILSAWDNRDSLTPLHVWVFHKNDMVRKGKGGCSPRVEFRKREGFSITNTPESLKEFEKWEVTDRLDKLKELCNRDRK